MHATRRGHSPLSSPPSLPTLASTDQSSPGRTFPFLRLALAIRTTAYAKETTKNGAVGALACAHGAPEMLNPS